jgi:hypothetical protein
MVLPGDVRWVECVAVRDEMATIRQLLGESSFDAWRSALKAFLCDYFSLEPPCVGKQGKNISPIAARVAHGKGLKVQFAYPGCGKRGGLRLAILAFCQNRVVKIAGAWRRKDDPDDDDFVNAFREHAT